jgi:hypothetical protein
MEPAQTLPLRGQPSHDLYMAKRSTRWCAGSSPRGRACCRPTTDALLSNASWTLFPEWYMAQSPRHLTLEGSAATERLDRGLRH